MNSSANAIEEVETFLASISDPRRKDEAIALDDLHRHATGCAPHMADANMVGYGSYRYRYESGREGTSFRAGFAPRKAALSIYLMAALERGGGEAETLFTKLGPHKFGKSCLTVTRLDRIDLAVLEQLVRLSWEIMAEDYPAD
jgi:hypothetical protein